MSIILLCEIKKKTMDFTLIQKQLDSHSIIHRKTFKTHPTSLIELQTKIEEFFVSQTLIQKMDKKIICGCFFSDKKLTNAMNLKFDNSKFNNLILDLKNDLIFIEKHELLILNNYSLPSSFFEFNKNKVHVGNRGMIVSIGNHLQSFEEHVGKNDHKEITRIELGELSFSPHTNFDHEFLVFIRKESKRTLKYREIITKSGLKLVYLFHVYISHGTAPKEPSFGELLSLIADKDEFALKSVEYFVRILAHFLYSGMILIRPNKEVILTGNFLRKVFLAFNNDEKIREVFLNNLVLANHVKHTFEHLRISLQTNIQDLILKSILENF